MLFLVVAKIRLSKSYDVWKGHFDAARPARQAAGTQDVFCCPVIGEQAALYGVKTRKPRRVHDMVYTPGIGDEIAASGYVVGSEVLTICEWLDG